jgi:hypothetical protein
MRPTQLSLVVDDFGIQYVGREQPPPAIRFAHIDIYSVVVLDLAPLTYTRHACPTRVDVY